MLRLTVRGSNCRSDQTALSETLTSSSSLLSLSPMSALDLHCGLKSNSAPSPKSANKRHRACYSRSRWSRPDVGTCPSSKRAANRCCRQQHIHLRYISCVASLCCQGIPPGYRIDTARQQITTLVETKKNAQLWLEDSVDTNQRNLVFQPCMISLSKTNGGVNIHNLINRGAT